MRVRITIEVDIVISEIMHRGMKGHMSEEALEKAGLSAIAGDILDAVEALKGHKTSDGVVDVTIMSSKIAP